MPTFALNFSRPGGEIIAQYYNFLRLGRKGYTDVQKACSDTAQWLGTELGKLGLFDMIYDGEGGLPAVAYKLTEGAHGFTLYDLSERVRIRGWQIASYPLPENKQDTIVQRILVRHGVTRDLAKLLLDDIQRAVEHLQKNPVPHSSARAGFSHG